MSTKLFEVDQPDDVTCYRDGCERADDLIPLQLYQERVWYCYPHLEEIAYAREETQR